MLNSFMAKKGNILAFRWRIALLILLVLCVVGIPGTWLLAKRSYVVTGAVKITLPKIILPWSSESVPPALSHYQSFMHTQSEIVTSNQVLQRVADDLADKSLTFFEDRGSGFIAKLRRRLNCGGVGPEPATVLKQAILDKIITAEPVIEEALIKVSMRWTNSEESIRIVDSFIRNYIIVHNSKQNENQWLAGLRNEQKVLAEKLKSQREQLNALAQKFGAKFPTTFDRRQEIMLARMKMLRMEAARLEVRRINLVAQAEMLKDSVESPDSSKEEQAVEQEKLLNAKNELTNVQTKLELTKTHEQRLRDMLTEENTETIELGRHRQDLEELQDELSLTKQMYDTICGRIKELEMQYRRPTTISVAYNAHVVHVRDVRWKFTIVLVLSVMVSTILLFISNRLF